MINKFIIAASIFLMFSCDKSNQKKINHLNKIKENFKTPTEDNSLWTYWYWLRDDISKEGITKDLEAMKKVGIGAAFIGNINPEEKDGKIPNVLQKIQNN